jgi:5,10-methylenetetrahydromethanopterin reductase
MPRPQLWTMGVSLPKLAARQAERAEAAGWDGLLMVDSQNLAGDTYIALAMAAHVTERIGLATGVTNPWTRHPAVTASAIATVQAESGGRAVLGIGRGDSALAHIGLAPASVKRLERYVSQVQTYLRREGVPFADLIGPGDAGAPPSLDHLGLADAPEDSRLAWLRPGQPKVPVDIAATGPKVIAVAGRVADRVTFAVGADPDRLAWAIDTVRKARADAGLDPESLGIGAYINVVAHSDIDTARQLASGGLASFARFSVMHGQATGPVGEAQREVLEDISRRYDMTHHTRADGAQTAALTPEFIDRFGVVGRPERCVERMVELAGLGIDRFAVIGPSAGADRVEGELARQTFENEVIPAFSS